MINKIFIHDDLGEIKVINKVEKSRTKYIVKILERGPGWDSSTQNYKGVKVKSGWFRGENREFETEHIVHKNTLTNEKRN